MELEVVKKYLNEMLAKEHIIPSDFPVSSFILIVKKSGGSLQICVDYREVNAVIIKDQYLLLLICGMLFRLAKAKLFFKSNIIAAFT
jgi:hypothetical protein